MLVCFQEYYCFLHVKFSGSNLKGKGWRERERERERWNKQQLLSMNYGRNVSQRVFINDIPAKIPTNKIWLFFCAHKHWIIMRIQLTETTTTVKLLRLVNVSSSWYKKWLLKYSNKRNVDLFQMSTITCNKIEILWLIP